MNDEYSSLKVISGSPFLIPCSSFVIHHSSFIIHHSSFIISNMAIKESSDELNPPVMTQEPVAAVSQPSQSFKDYFARTIATCGVGYLPLAPGTWGSLVGIGLYLLVRGWLMKALFDVAPEFRLNTFHLFYAIIAIELLFVALLSLLGAWAASHTEKLSTAKDPGIVVIDEVVGQFIALLPVPFLLTPAWWALVLAFILFRFFDIVKPYPARKFESLHGGLGIMADDIVAGIYAAIGVALAVTVSWFF
jgi:phosphatidylglycerophosphatase A